MAHYPMEGTISRKRVYLPENSSEDASQCQSSKISRRSAHTDEATINVHTASLGSQPTSLETNTSSASANSPISSKCPDVKNMGCEILLQHESMITRVWKILKCNDEDTAAFEDWSCLIKGIALEKYKNFRGLMRDNGALIKKIRTCLIGPKKSEGHLGLWKDFDSFLVQAVKCERYRAVAFTFEDYMFPDQSFFDTDEEEDLLESMGMLRVVDKWYPPLTPPIATNF